MNEEQLLQLHELVGDAGLAAILKALQEHARSQAEFAFGLYAEDHSQPGTYEGWQDWEAVAWSLEHAWKNASRLELA